VKLPILSLSIDIIDQVSHLTWLNDRITSFFIDIVGDNIMHFAVDIIPKKIKYSEYLELVKKGQEAKSND